MRSMKLLAATALVAALVAGPVLAQDATLAPAADTPALSDVAAPAKTVKHHHAAKKHHKPAKKHHHHHAKKAVAAPVEEVPAAQ